MAGWHRLGWRLALPAVFLTLLACKAWPVNELRGNDTSPAGRHLALVIGAVNHGFASDPADYADDDASAIADRLTCLYGRDDVKLLIGANANEAAVGRAFRDWLEPKETSDDVSLHQLVSSMSSKGAVNHTSG